MAQTRRRGRPLLTSAQEFPSRLPLATRELNAALNALLNRAGCTYVEVVEENGLELSPKQTSRQMRETLAGPTAEFFDAILRTAAARLGVPLDKLHNEFDPLLKKARSVPPKPTTVPGFSERASGTPTASSVAQDPELRLKADWLADLLMSNEESRAADELAGVFPDRDELVEVLVYVGDIDPGMIAALLDEIAFRDFAYRVRIGSAIKAMSSETAKRIAAVSSSHGGEEIRLLEQDPMIPFGRRLAGVINKNIDRALREVVARAKELSSGQESLLAAIIDSGPDGPACAATLLSELAEHHSEQMFSCALQLVRHVRRTGRRELLVNLDSKLIPQVRVEILGRLGLAVRVPNQVGLDSDELNGLATFVEALSADTDRLAAALCHPQISGSRRHAAGHIIEAVPRFAPVLEVMLADGRLDPAARLLDRAISDWSDRLQPWEGLPELYRPLIDLAEAVFALQSPLPITGYLLDRFPNSGRTLFQTMLWREKRRLPGLVGQLAIIPGVLGSLVRMLVDVPQGRRQLRVCEQLVAAAGDQADPVLEALIDIYPARFHEVLSYSSHHAPRFSARMTELLATHRPRETQPASDPETAAIHEILAGVRSITGPRHSRGTDVDDEQNPDEVSIFITEPGDLSSSQRSPNETAS